MIRFQNWLYRKCADRPSLKGMGTVEVILILIVLIGLVFIFRTQITGLVNTLMGRVSTGALNIK